MRTIKFRAWNKREKEMMNVVKMIFTKEGIECSYKNLAGFCGEIDEVIIMQFTGLKDKNGKEIFEGDILKDEYNIIWTVHFVMGKFSIFCNTDNLLNSIEAKRNKKLTDDEKIVEDLDAWWVRKEIIGNKFENPELLEVQSKKKKNKNIDNAIAKEVEEAHKKRIERGIEL